MAHAPEARSAGSAGPVPGPRVQRHQPVHVRDLRRPVCEHGVPAAVPPGSPRLFADRGRPGAPARGDPPDPGLNPGRTARGPSRGAQIPGGGAAPHGGGPALPGTGAQHQRAVVGAPCRPGLVRAVVRLRGGHPAGTARLRRRSRDPGGAPVDRADELRARPASWPRLRDQQRRIPGGSPPGERAPVHRAERRLLPGARLAGARHRRRGGGVPRRGPAAHRARSRPMAPPWRQPPERRPPRRSTSP